MRRAVALLALVATACAPSLWERRLAVAGGRLHIPRVFAPLRPGSIYPDRARPAPAVGRPGVVLAGPVDALAPLGQRGLVVLRPGRVDLASIEGAAAVLRRRGESGGPVGLVLLGAGPDLARAAAGSGLFDAVVLVGLDLPEETGAPAAPRVPILVLGRTAGGAPPEGFSERAARALGAPPLERWYRAPAGWPREAWRDVAEWLAGILGATGPVD